MSAQPDCLTSPDGRVATLPAPSPLPADDGRGMGSVGARDIVTVLDRAIARSKPLRALEPQECDLCGAWLPCPDEHPVREIACTGCGAGYLRSVLGRWERFLSLRDVQNPHFVALYMRRYGCDADYIRHLGWVVPPPHLLVRFPGESVDR